MRIKFEIDKNNRNEFMNVDDDYDNTDISIEINEEGNQVVTILLNRELVLDGDERNMIPQIEETE
tara:strand:+ start:2612 stop:2806 length:195 start_codon:yes stop_codon:yes gene_type:complete